MKNKKQKRNDNLFNPLLCSVNPIIVDKCLEVVNDEPVFWDTDITDTSHEMSDEELDEYYEDYKKYNEDEKDLEIQELDF